MGNKNEISIFRQLLLIIWKGWLIRKRHFIVTGFELLIPVLFICLFVYFRTLVGPLRGKHTNIYSDTTNYHNATFFKPVMINERLYIFGSNNTVLYSPNSVIAKNIVMEATKQLNPPERCYIEYKGVDSEDEMVVYVLKEQLESGYNRKQFGFVFNNLDKGLPQRLDYKIKLNGRFFTNMKFQMYSSGPRNYYDDQYESSFWYWQNAVDNAFMTFKTNETGKPGPNATLYLQRYPYPPYRDSKNALNFVLFLPYVIIYGLILVMPIFVKRIIDEKVNRAKELMRMMGLNDLVYFTGVFLNTYIILFVVSTIMAILFSVDIQKDVAVLDFSNGFLFWVILNLYMINALLFCLAISTFFNKSVLGAIVTFILWNASYAIPSNLMDSIGTPEKYSQLTLSAKLASCLLPNCAIHWSCKIMSLFESNLQGASWININSPGTPDDNFTLLMVIGMMLVSMVMYMFIIWYVDNVWPWQFGIPKHPGYIFMPSYWFPKRKLMKGSYSASFNEYPVDKQYFEEEPEGMKQGILLKGLSKIFGRGASRKVAVDSVSMAMLEGQITVLLGHNGAGKTTTMNVLTGIFVPSSGTAMINGFDIVTATKQARRSLGLCPQHNVLYDNLTVEEHLKFFAGLKGMPFSQMPTEVTSVINLLDLEPKRHTLSTALSGGMKRKLSLGIAIVADSQVLVLDEPTSGMDPQARRAVWDLLQRVRSERTILLTTHYMEEADVLGDKIAIMAEGKVQCAGSPLFLKRKFGAGYNLKFAKGDNFQSPKVIDIIKKHVPNTILDSETPREACFLLPTNDSKTFADMFDEIESEKSLLGFNTFGLSITTMEDVFLKVGQLAEKATVENDQTPNGTSDNLENDTRESIIIARPLVGVALFRSRVKGLWLKRFHDAKRYIGFFLFQFLLPITISALLLYILISVDSSGNLNNDPALTLSLKEEYGSTYSFFSGNNQTIVNQYKTALSEARAEASENSDPIGTVLAVGENKLVDFKQKYMVSGALNDQGDHLNLTALYNGEPFHVGAMSINIMNNAYLKYLTEDSGAGITVTNHPFPQNQMSATQEQASMINEVAIRILFSVLFPAALSYLSASFVLFPVHERITKSKLLQKMTGIGGFMFWVVHFLWDFMVLIIAITALIGTFAIANPQKYNGHDGALGSLFVLLLLYGWSAIPFNYILSFKGKKPSSGFIFASSVSSIAGLLLTLSISLYRILDRTPTSADNLAYLFRLVPDFSVTWGASNIHVTAQKNGFCKSIDPLVIQYICPVLAQKYPESGIIPCCPNECKQLNNCFEPESYLTFGPTSCGRDMLFLAITGFLYFGILILLETNFVRVWYRFKSNILPRLIRSIRPTTQTDTPLVQSTMAQRSLSREDWDVSQERTRVETLSESNQVSSEALVVLNLTKSFSNFVAVDHLTFALHKDECFGLLGVNGAGKTTTFSMLTGDLVIGEGNAFMGNYNLKDNLKMCQNKIGYCPQFDALLDRMTGREALYLFARLRGMPESEMEQSVNNIMHMVDLQAHADKVAEKYSGGTRRKLSLALSLIGGPSVVFLDEPTAGVDPQARRKIWNTFTKVQNIGGMSFILTTHSMEECEALCSRLAIMVNGEFKCLGSIQHLKGKFGQGYTMIVKLQKEQAFDPNHALQVRQHIENTFNGIHLKDEHQGLLHYHLTDNSIPWSVIFRELEKVKSIFQLEDYLVSDTTLEQIFLAFARTQRVTAEVST